MSWLRVDGFFFSKLWKWLLLHGREVTDWRNYRFTRGRRRVAFRLFLEILSPASETGVRVNR